MKKVLAATFVSCISFVALADGMTTVFGEKVTAANVWREYPRPQMERGNWTCLNGLWDYAVVSVTNAPGRPRSWDGKILVPFAPEAKLSGVGRIIKRDEYLWYTRTITCAPKKGERTLLHFGGVDFRAMVFIGHREVTDVPHEGGNVPFTLDITDYVKPGENELNVCVWDPLMSFIGSSGKQCPKPGGCFYTRVSGIWQTVWMEQVPETYIADYRVIAHPETSSVDLKFSVGGLQRGETVRVTAFDGARKVAVAEGVPGDRISLKIPSPAEEWTPETPHLYTFRADYGRDSVKGYFALRSFEVKKDARGVLRFFLNGKPRYIMGVLDQGWWPDGLLTPPSEAAMRFDLETFKACGFDMIRKHIKVEPLRFYHLCDRLGVLVVQDMPSSNSDWRSAFKPATTDRYAMFRNELRDMVDLLQKSPSVVMWAPYNEGWAEHGEFLVHTTMDWLKRYDPSRPVDGPSGWQDFEGGLLFYERQSKPLRSEHKPLGECEAGDVVDLHAYRGPGMHPVNPRRASFLGEFGGLGHPVAGHLWNETSKENWGYSGIDDTKTREGLEKTYLGLMEKLGPLARAGLAGSVYTQATDIEIEINGLMTYDRKVLKFSPAVLKAAHDKVRAAAAEGFAPPRSEKADLLVVGGDEAACAAAIQAARMGVKDVLLVSDCEMLGGQYSAQGVGPVDERVKVNGASVDFPRSGLALEIMEAIEAWNLHRYGKACPGNAWSASHTIEPAAAAAIFEKLVGKEGPRLRVLRGYEVEGVLREGSRICGVRFTQGLEVRAKLVIDSSDWGDVIRLGGVKHYTGADPKSRFNEPSAPDKVGMVEAQEMNPITWTITLRESSAARPVAKPQGYDTFFFEKEDIWNESGIFKTTYPSDVRCVPYTQRRLVDTRHFNLPGDAVETIQLNATCMDYPLCEWPAAVAEALKRLGNGLERLNFAALPREGKRIVYDDAKRRALAYLYFLQNDNPATVARMRRFEIAGDFGTPDGLPPKPYIREGVRLAAVKMLTENEVRATDANRPDWAACPADAAFGFQFHIDFHPTRRSYPSVTHPTAWRPKFSGGRDWNAAAKRSFFPYSGFVPQEGEGLLGGGKNIGVSSIAQAALRLHPQMVLSGQCAGALAATALASGKSPRAVVADAKAVGALQERMVRGAGGKPGVAIWAWQNLAPGDPDFVKANIPVVRTAPDATDFTYRR